VEGTDIQLSRPPSRYLQILFCVCRIPMISMNLVDDKPRKGYVAVMFALLKVLIVPSLMAVAATGVCFCTMVGATASTENSALHRTVPASIILFRCVRHIMQ
jgi:hypothetical protein